VRARAVDDPLGRDPSDRLGARDPVRAECPRPHEAGDVGIGADQQAPVLGVRPNTGPEARRFERAGSNAPVRTRRFERAGSNASVRSRRFERAGSNAPVRARRFERAGSSAPVRTRRFERAGSNASSTRRC